MSKNQYKEKAGLSKLSGCRGCEKDCLWSGLVATKEVAERFKGRFNCNSQGGE